MQLYTYCAKQLSIIDGDTIRCTIDLGFHITLSNQIIRINSIDAPESRSSDKIERAYGLLTKKRVIELLDPLNKEILFISNNKHADKYGRLLGDFYIPNTTELLSNRLVTEYLAVPYDGQNKDSIKQAHLDNRKQLALQGIIYASE